MNSEQDTQHTNSQNLECLGTITGNCIMVDRLQGSIKYPSKTRALLQKGPETIKVFTWPGAEVGHVSQPLSDVLDRLLVGPTGTVSTELNTFLGLQNPPKTSYPAVIIDATVFASPSPTPTLTVILMLFSASEHSAEVLRIFEENNLRVEIIKGYCPDKCSGVPHALHAEIGQRAAPGKLVHGCKTPLLTHQQQAVEFILKLESPGSTTLSTFWSSSTCNWLRQAFYHTATTGRTTERINHNSQGSILADNMGLGKTLTSLALILTSKNAAESFANARALLVICPLSTLPNWDAEIRKHLDLSLTKYAVYHGEEQKKWTTQHLWANDIVLVTYDTVANLYESPRCDALFEPTWFRTILDEAHLIRDPATKRSRAILALQTERKLCLTGTPLQNQLSDLYTLLRFIRVDPWSREEVWQTFIKPNIRRKSAKAIELLQQLPTVSLRRLKTDVLQLPPKVEEYVGLPLPEPWQEDYNNRYNEFSDKFGVDRGGGSWDSSEFFQELTMLRLYCDHPSLIDGRRYNLPKKEMTWRDSPKIVHLMSDLKGHLYSEQSGQVPKAVVFSQWTSFLEIVGNALGAEDIAYEQLDGSRSLQQREKSLHRIRHEPNV
ncbi:hypothetical protein PSTG_04346 [Puccinia striiformis f. sp. tritici PST-78]|uniref:Helicase ATP-binding domain-containing protein n=1 Tax=Puccinia striiformis f. sp. tritici PST-78 TaxID=1165861 RepID=A0A0L0VTX0_9BASI|nr:hypothetical protein PSTG_04346 [Puccinia striiformis f. sp. tritici PST-78]